MAISIDIREEAGVTEEQTDATTHENIPMALVGWSTGSMLIWSTLFMIGNFLYDRKVYAYSLLAVSVVCAAILTWVVSNLWTAKSTPGNQAKP